MSPDETVQLVADFIAANAQFVEEDVYAVMTSAGVIGDNAYLAYMFTQAAWGRVLLADLGIAFSDDFYCINANGDVIESGALSNEPHFVAASRIGARLRYNEGFKRLAATSADFNTVNQALNDGSRPEDLRSAPLMIFMEPPTKSGLAKVDQFMHDVLAQPKALKRSWFQRLFGRRIAD